ncbi:sodium-dependent transporter [Umboniibacter marinipuniceus]|uniref:NSS family neurotransmitter:Na+ symporter n=1 Tax=Umboniibacter marinipuniceus TaxID=569599 RepID=A0A3M0AE31_9GAMM|nr:sodium-dependent transporter [Umboniibacter marinipuniceus]RMA81018.1 NSS family neurotransmitter:Na+ symporter [Umboniibacter marinipuniceus]
MTVSREHFGSRLGFVLAAAGSAVGIGNLVGFPVAAAKNGGGAFLLVYALFVAFICLPIMMAELTMGRASQKDPSKAYSALGGRGPIWGFAGIIGVLTPFMIAVFYSVITVWILGYFTAIISGDLVDLADPSYFGSFISSDAVFGYLAAVGVIVFAILAGGVKDGIERAAKLLMPTLFVMLIAMVIYTLTLPNAMAGVSYYLIPDVSKITPSVINGALSQAFFSLSLGMGILITYGSYMDRNTDIKQSAKLVALTDTLVAFSAGLLILPAIFSFDPQINTSELSESSVSLMFSFLPKIFVALQADVGVFWASTIACVFFLLVLVAAITSLVSIVEVPLSAMSERRTMNRKRSIGFMVLLLGAFGAAASMSFGLSDFFSQFVVYSGADKSLFDVIYDIFYDTILPLNGLLVCLFVMYKWKKANFQKALHEGAADRSMSWYDRYMNFALSGFIPLVLAVIFINTVMTKFFS